MDRQPTRHAKDSPARLPRPRSALGELVQILVVAAGAGVGALAAALSTNIAVSVADVLTQVLAGGAAVGALIGVLVALLSLRRQMQIEEDLRRLRGFAEPVAIEKRLATEYLGAIERSQLNPANQKQLV